MQLNYILRDIITMHRLYLIFIQLRLLSRLRTKNNTDADNTAHNSSFRQLIKQNCAPDHSSTGIFSITAAALIYIFPIKPTKSKCQCFLGCDTVTMGSPIYAFLLGCSISPTSVIYHDYHKNMVV